MEDTQIECQKNDDTNDKDDPDPHGRQVVFVNIRIETYGWEKGAPLNPENTSTFFRGTASGI
jgi:hypothetical protein